MKIHFKSIMALAFIMLMITVFFGVFSLLSYLYPEFFRNYLPFQYLRPIHVSASLFWIISSAVTVVLFMSNEFEPFNYTSKVFFNIFIFLWSISIVGIFTAYACQKFGGREYWEFPPALAIPILVSWLLLMIGFFQHTTPFKRTIPVYQLMWFTGILFFCFSFIEQNLWNISYFRESYIKEITIQWKSNGSLVGAWNQLIYGSGMYIMSKLSNDPTLARNKKAYFFFFLGLTNLMFNWGHHIYNVPTFAFIRDISYAISMTEWIILYSILKGFKSKMQLLQTDRKLAVLSYLRLAEVWVVMNLLLALFMSIPAVNRYTHGTHITVAHAMGTTIGINTLMLLACYTYIITVSKNRIIYSDYSFQLLHWGLLIFWIGLILAGVVKGYNEQILQLTSYREIMQPVNRILFIALFGGVTVCITLLKQSFNYFRILVA